MFKEAEIDFIDEEQRKKAVRFFFVAALDDRMMQQHIHLKSFIHLTSSASLLPFARNTFSARA